MAKKKSTAKKKPSMKRPASAPKRRVAKKSGGGSSAKKSASQTARPSMGSFVWHELMTPDVTGARKFYSALFGWKYEVMDMGQFNYTMFNVAGQEPSLGGMMAMTGPEWKGVPPHWMTYVAVSDVDATAKRCREMGGKVTVPPTDIPNNIGRFAILQDPSGAHISVYRSSRW